jgi:hypothetical protein
MLQFPNDGGELFGSGLCLGPIFRREDLSAGGKFSDLVDLPAIVVGLNPSMPRQSNCG